MTISVFITKINLCIYKILNLFKNPKEIKIHDQNIYNWIIMLAAIPFIKHECFKQYFLKYLTVVYFNYKYIDC